MNKLYSVIMSAALVLGSAAVASAQQAPAVNGAPQAGAWMGQNLSPAQTSGALTRYILGPAGGVRGFQLQNGAVVMLRPDEGTVMLQRVRVGQSVQVQGMVQQGASPQVFRHASVRGADGASIVEPRPMGPGMGRGGHPGMGRGGGAMGGHDRFERMASLPAHSVSGTVQTVLAGPRGHVHELLLSNNGVVIVTRPMAMAMGARQVRVGETIRANGRGGAFAQGSSVIAESLTFGDGSTVSAPLPSAPQAH